MTPNYNYKIGTCINKIIISYKNYNKIFPMNNEYIYFIDDDNLVQSINNLNIMYSIKTINIRSKYI